MYFVSYVRILEGLQKLIMTTQGLRLKKIRQTLGLSQEEFGAIFDIKKQFVSNIEKDHVVLNNDKLVKLLVDYKVNINYLLAGIGSMFLGQDKKPDNFKSDVKQAIIELMREGQLSKDDFI